MKKGEEVNDEESDVDNTNEGNDNYNEAENQYSSEEETERNVNHGEYKKMERDECGKQWEGSLWMIDKAP